MENENKEVAVVDRVKEVIDKSGVAFEIDITELFSLSERAKAITTVDDENFLPVKKEMQRKRKDLTEYFEAARKEFNALSKGVIDVQKLVLAEFTPEEDRLIELDKAEKERITKEARAEALPAKRERITTAGIEFTDEEVLSMTDADFEIEYNVRLGAKLEADRVAAEEARIAAQAEIDAQKAEIERQKEEGDRIEKARAEEREKAAEELRLAKERSEREVKESSERIERERKEAEDRRMVGEKELIARVEREEKERQESISREKQEAEDAKAKEIADKAEAEAERLADEKYQNFLKENSFNETTDLIIEGKIYRFVAEFKAQ